MNPWAIVFVAALLMFIASVWTYDHPPSDVEIETAKKVETLQTRSYR
jgi:hypothetical protein